MNERMAVGHVDADCFYVSAERVRDESLRGKPVGVLGNQGACVIAKSYEMKAAGVTTGMPIWDAQKLCPEGIYVKRDFRWYEVLSRQMLEVVREFFPRVEYYSIDEFFFQAVSWQGRDFADTARALRDAVLERIGVPVTVGIARTRTLAKLISDSAKPFGARAVLDRPAEEELLAGLPVTEISGIAKRRAARLAPYGIRTCLEFARADGRFIRSLLTVTGETLWRELNGERVEPIRPERPPHKMLSRGGSLGEATTHPRELYAWLIRHLERLIEELEYHEVLVGQLDLWVGYKDHLPGMARIVPEVPTARFDLLAEAARHALRRAFRPGAAATRMHLIASRLVLPAAATRSLFEPPGETAAAIASVKRQINSRIGRFSLRSGATLPLQNVYEDTANSYDICDIRDKICFS